MSVKVTFSRLSSKTFRLMINHYSSQRLTQKIICVISDIICLVKDGHRGRQ